MIETAENLARDYRISRESADAFAARSQHKAAAAWSEGRFADEVVPVSVPQRRVHVPMAVGISRFDRSVMGMIVMVVVGVGMLMPMVVMRVRVGHDSVLLTQSEFLKVAASISAVQRSFLTCSGVAASPTLLPRLLRV